MCLTVNSRVLLCGSLEEKVIFMDALLDEINLINQMWGKKKKLHFF